MKRDWHLVRELLRRASCLDQPMRARWLVREWDAEIVERHADLMANGELLQVDGDQVVRVTWRGHDLLDAIREPWRWSMVQQALARHAMPLTEENILAVGAMDE